MGEPCVSDKLFIDVLGLSIRADGRFAIIAAVIIVLALVRWREACRRHIPVTVTIWVSFAMYLRREAARRRQSMSMITLILKDGPEIDVDIADIERVEREGEFMRVYFRGGQSRLVKHLPDIGGGAR
jgi:hypothetical protein